MFSDQATFTTTFTVGSADLTLNGEQGNPTAYTFDTWTSSSLAQGSEVYATLTVANDGSLPLSYTISAPSFATTDSAELQAALIAGAKVVTGACEAATYEAAPVTVVSDGAISAFALTTARPLAAQTSETLCVKAELPADAPGTLQGAVVTPTVQFVATQTT